MDTTKRKQTRKLGSVILYICHFGNKKAVIDNIINHNNTNIKPPNTEMATTYRFKLLSGTQMWWRQPVDGITPLDINSIKPAIFSSTQIRDSYTEIRTYTTVQ